MRNWFYMVFIVIFLFLIPLANGLSQAKRLQFIHLTPDEGLSSSMITSIIQDQRGFIWIGTHYGLNRYDGLNFLNYKNDSEDSLSLINDYVQTLLEDRHGNLLIGTEGGLALYDRKKDCFRDYMSEKASPLKGMNFLVTKMIEDSLSNLWLATSAGLIYFDREKNRIRQFTHSPDDSQSISDNDVEYILIDDEKRFWVATRKGLNLFHPEAGVFTHINNAAGDAEDLSGKVFWSIVEDREGDIWFGSNDGLYRLKKSNSTEIESLTHYSYDPNDKFSLSINQVVSLFVDNSGDLWVGTENGGINLFDRDNNRFWHYRKNENDPQSLNNESIQAIFQDKTGNLWFGTYTGGLNIFIKNRNGITSYLAFPFAPVSLSHNTVTSFIEQESGEIWISTDGGGLYLLDSTTNSFDRFKIDNSKLSSNSIVCMEEDSDGSIWLGTWAGGLVHLDRKTKVMRSYTRGNSGIQDDNIVSILKGDDNDLWLGSYDHGLIHYKIKENRFTNITPNNSEISGAAIIKLERFTDHQILIGTSGNFQIYSPKDGKFKTYEHDPGNLNSLSDSKVIDFLVQNDTCIWIGTAHGLNRFNPVTESFKHYYEKDGLQSNSIKGLLLDNSGKLWVTNNKGVCRLDYMDKKFKNFVKADGLLSNELSERAVLKTKSGSLLVGGTKGFNIIYPEKIAENKNIPSVLITDFKISNKSVKPDASGSPLTQNITETENITLTHKQSVITFYFTVMDFSAPEKNQFAHKLEGFDEDWIYSGNKGEATYTNLNQGDYVFRVKGSNNDNVWNETGTFIKLKILPPWWLTLWFKMIVFCFLALVLVTSYIYRVGLLKKQKELLEKTVANKTTELKELNASKDKFFSIIAHDLKNPFNTIIGFSEMLNEEMKTENLSRIRQYAGMINVSAVQTLKLLENLLDWAKSQQGTIPFKPEKLEMQKIIEDEFLVLREMAFEKNISVSQDCHPQVLVMADKNMLRTILRNLISNAIKFTHRNGKVEVKSTIIGDMVVISVRDTGTGMSEATKAELFKIEANGSTPGTDNEKGTGLGLLLCKEFVEKHGGRIWTETRLGKGSVFTFQIPLYVSNPL